jgi:hypothetical protein
MGSVVWFLGLVGSCSCRVYLHTCDSRRGHFLSEFYYLRMYLYVDKLYWFVMFTTSVIFALPRASTRPISGSPPQTSSRPSASARHIRLATYERPWHLAYFDGGMLQRRCNTNSVQGTHIAFQPLVSSIMHIAFPGSGCFMAPVYLASGYDISD